MDQRLAVVRPTSEADLMIINLIEVRNFISDILLILLIKHFTMMGDFEIWSGCM
jgi:hypothetical protein